MTDKPDWQEIANNLRGKLSNIETEFVCYCKELDYALDYAYERNNMIFDAEKRSEFKDKWKSADRLTEEIDIALRESYKLINFIEEKLI